MNKREEVEWIDYAVCGEEGAAPMFPNEGDERGIYAAKANCAACPVVIECLTQAMANGERFGVWGGLTPDEREEFRRLSRRRTKRAAQIAADAEAFDAVAAQ